LVRPLSSIIGSIVKHNSQPGAPNFLAGLRGIMPAHGPKYPHRRRSRAAYAMEIGQMTWMDIEKVALPV
jgi:hypothetical protein